jgi:hypothetical protein
VRVFAGHSNGMLGGHMDGAARRNNMFECHMDWLDVILTCWEVIIIIVTC